MPSLSFTANNENYSTSSLDSFIHAPGTFVENGPRIREIREYWPEIDHGVLTQSDSRHSSSPRIVIDEANNDYLCYIKKIPVNRLSREVATCEHIKRLGAIRTFQVLSVIRNKDDGLFVTLALPDLVPFAEINITDISQFVTIAEKAIEAVRQCNLNGVMHNDFCPKNIGFQMSNPNSIFVYDFEFAEIRDRALTLDEHIHEIEFFLEHLRFQAFECKCKDENGVRLALEEYDSVISKLVASARTQYYSGSRSIGQ